MKITRRDYELIVHPELRDPELERRRKDTLARSARLTAQLAEGDPGQGITVRLKPTSVR